MNLLFLRLKDQLKTSFTINLSLFILPPLGDKRNWRCYPFESSLTWDYLTTLRIKFYVSDQKWRSLLALFWWEPFYEYPVTLDNILAHFKALSFFDLFSCTLQANIFICGIFTFYTDFNLDFFIILILEVSLHLNGLNIFILFSLCWWFRIYIFIILDKFEADCCARHSLTAREAECKTLHQFFVWENGLNIWIYVWLTPEKAHWTACSLKSHARQILQCLLPFMHRKLS